MAPLKAMKQTKLNYKTIQRLCIHSCCPTSVIWLKSRVSDSLFHVNIRVPFPACCSTLVTSLNLIGYQMTPYFPAILDYPEDRAWTEQREGQGSWSNEKKNKNNKKLKLRQYLYKERERKKRRDIPRVSSGVLGNPRSHRLNKNSLLTHPT